MGVNKAVSRNTADHPQYSRVFVIFNKQVLLTENDLNNWFSKFGNIEGIHIVKDKTSKLSKGLAYIKFSKMSEAMLAIEEMNGMTIKSHSCTLTVRVAKKSSEGKNAEEVVFEQLRRLFVTAPKDVNEEEVRNFFCVFGKIIGFRMFKPKVETDSRGNLIYITYKKASATAKALEATGKHSTYKVIIARPQPPCYKSAEPLVAVGESDDVVSCDSSIHVTCSSSNTTESVCRLFDIAPDFKSAKLILEEGSLSQYIVTYASPSAADYARNKYNGFEYPPGECIVVKKNTICTRSSSICEHGFSKDTVPVEPIKTKRPLISIQPTDNFLIQTIGCSVPLPPPQPMVSRLAYDEDSGRCLYITFYPRTPRMSAIDDVFCRFGNYCGSYIAPKKDFGYAYFLCPYSAKRALRILNDSYIGLMKVQISMVKPKSG